MKVLIACEKSQEVCKAFRAKGHEAYSCDVIPCSGGHPEWHLQCDATQLLKISWDMIIAFPPCTYLSNAGACRLYPQKGVLNQSRYEKGLAAKDFFLQFYNAKCPRIAVENPVSSRIYKMPPHTQEIQPFQYGHPYTKKTRLWLKGLPPLVPTEVVQPIGPYIPSGTGRKDKSKYGIANSAKIRSKTFSGIAQAMAEQWGNIKEDESDDSDERGI